MDEVYPQKVMVESHRGRLVEETHLTACTFFSVHVRPIAFFIVLSCLAQEELTLMISRRCFFFFLMCFLKKHLHLHAMSLIGDFNFTTFCSTSSTQIPSPTSPLSSMTTLTGTRYPMRATPLLSGQSKPLSTHVANRHCQRCQYVVTHGPLERWNSSAS